MAEKLAVGLAILTDVYWAAYSAPSMVALMAEVMDMMTALCLVL